MHKRLWAPQTQLTARSWTLFFYVYFMLLLSTRLDPVRAAILQWAAWLIACPCLSLNKTHKSRWRMSARVTGNDQPAALSQPCKGLKRLSWLALTGPHICLCQNILLVITDTEALLGMLGLIYELRGRRSSRPAELCLCGSCASPCAL